MPSFLFLTFRTPWALGTAACTKVENKQIGRCQKWAKSLSNKSTEFLDSVFGPKITQTLSKKTLENIIRWYLQIGSRFNMLLLVWCVLEKCGIWNIRFWYVWHLSCSFRMISYSCYMELNFWTLWRELGCCCLIFVYGVCAIVANNNFLPRRTKIFRTW